MPIVVHEAIRGELLRSVCEAARVLCGARATSVALLDETADELVFVAAAGEAADEITGCRIDSHHGLAGAVAHDGEPLEVRDLEHDARFSHEVATETGYEPDAMTIVPMLDAGRVAGVLSVLDPSGEPTPATRAALTALAAHATAALGLSSALERTLAP